MKDYAWKVSMKLIGGCFVTKMYLSASRSNKRETTDMMSAEMMSLYWYLYWCADSK